MLPFVVAAGHHNYIYSLPMCLKEMNNLKNPAPYVYQNFRNDQYDVPKAESFKCITSDIAHGQT